MSPTHTRRRGRTYCYYVARAAIEAGYDTAPVTTVPAGDVEAAVLTQLQQLLTTPEMIALVWTTARAAPNDDAAPISEAEVTGLLADFGSRWPELFPAEQARLMQVLVERVDVLEDGLELRLKATGLASLVAELRPHKPRQHEPRAPGRHPRRPRPWNSDANAAASASSLPTAATSLHRPAPSPTAPWSRPWPVPGAGSGSSIAASTCR